MIFPRIIELYPKTKLHVSNRTRFFNIFEFASFTLLKNLITRLHVKFLPKLRKNYKNVAFRGRPAATVL